MVPQGVTAAASRIPGVGPGWRTWLGRHRAVLIGVAVAIAVSLRGWHTVDLLVYRAAGSSIAHGLSPYRDGFAATVGWQPLPFTYPPVAAFVFVAWAVVPLGVARFGVAAMSSALVVWVADRLLRRDAASHRGAGRLGVACVAVAWLVMVGGEPMRETLALGQIDALLLAAVAFDCLGPRTALPRGVLVGAATALKPTPAAFVIFFLVGRDRRAALHAAAAFAGVTLGAAVLAPTDSWRYWTSTVLDSSHVGALSYAGNQSLRGALERLGASGPLPTAVWLVGAALVLAAACGAAYHLRRRGDDGLAFVVIATAALVAAPVAWSHHWVLAGPALVYLTGRARRPHEFAALAAAAAVFAVGPHWLLSGRREPSAHWNLAQSVVGDAYVWIGCIFIAATTVAVLRTRPAR